MGSSNVWNEFVYRELKLRAAEYQTLLTVDDPDDSPYDSSYAAADVQAKVIAAAEGFKGQDDLDMIVGGVTVAYDTLMCRLYIRKGLALVGTDLVQEATQCFTKGLACNAALDAMQQDICMRMSALSNLGLIYCNRADYKQALTYLTQVEALYLQGTSDRQCLATSRALHVLEGLEEPLGPWFEQLYTLALFYIAQAHQQCGQTDEAAQYCAVTLGRQVKFGLADGSNVEDALDYNHWIQNAAQLSCYYFNDGRFASAHHILNAADDMLRRSKDKGTTAEDVAANMDVAWARYYLSRLDMSAARGTPTDAAPPLPECVQFPGLDLPPEASMPWGGEAVATTFDDMRALFSLCMPRIRAALAYYKLDGAVSDHVQLLFDGALAYRDLAWFEADAHRRCVMHKNRVKMFKAVDGTLSFQHFPGLVRSIMLECANAFRDIVDVKAANKWSDSKVYAAAMEATTHYSRLFDTFREEGDLPDNIDDDEWERPLLTACIEQARIHVKTAGTDGRILNRGQALLKYFADYTQRNKVENFVDEIAVCAELSALVQEKIGLLSCT